MYHYVRPIAGSRYPGIRGLDLTDFVGQLDYIERHYNVVTVADVVQAKTGCKPLPDYPLLMSFDDGYSDHYRYVFPVLKQRNLTGVFFPPARAVVERKMLDVNKIHFLLAGMSDYASLVSHIEHAVELMRDDFPLLSLAEYRAKYWQANRFDSGEVIYVKRMLQHALPEILRTRIIENLFHRYVSEDETGFADELYVSEQNLGDMLAAGMEIGSHGYAHYWLDSLSVEDQTVDIDHSLEFLERVGVQRQGFYFCYPYGGYSSETVGILRTRNCAAAFTTRVALADMDSTGLLELPRLDTNDLPKLASTEPVTWTQQAKKNAE